MAIDRARQWVVAIYDSPDDPSPAGTGVLIDEWRVLTSAHVVRNGRVPAVRAIHSPQHARAFLAVTTVIYADERLDDTAVLHLASPLPLTPAPLRRPKPEHLLNLGWSAVGSLALEPLGDVAQGVVTGESGLGWVRLDPAPRYKLQRGFSGSGVWIPDYGAVVGIIGQADNNGGGRAILLDRLVDGLPSEALGNLTDWPTPGLARRYTRLGGWTNARHTELSANWNLRARGASSSQQDTGDRFCGREAVLARMGVWIGAVKPERQVLVLTGQPGSGKSSTLARYAALADRIGFSGVRRPRSQTQVLTGSVSCLVSARGKTALEVAAQICVSVAGHLPGNLDEFLPSFADGLSRGTEPWFSVVVDSLDEAATSQEARLLITQVLVPLAESSLGANIRVVVGSRQRDEDGDLIRSLGRSALLIDLDSPEYFAVEDLTSYCLANLQLLGDERPQNPYRDATVAGSVAERIAKLSLTNFLVAGLVSRSHGLYDVIPAEAADIRFSPNVDDILLWYLGRVPSVAGISAVALMTGLVHALDAGFTISQWQESLESIQHIRISQDALLEFAHGAAANFLLSVQVDDGTPCFRLYHEALRECLLARRVGLGHRVQEDQRRWTQYQLELGRRRGWATADNYVRRNLPIHAHQADLLDEVLEEDDFLLHADLGRLRSVASAAHSSQAKQRALLVQLTPEIDAATASERIAAFSVTEVLEGLGTNFVIHPAPPSNYRARWADGSERGELRILEAGGWVFAVGCAQLADRDGIVAASDDGHIYVWDANGFELLAKIGSDDLRHVAALTSISVSGRHLVALADGTSLLIKDLESGRTEVTTRSIGRGGPATLCSSLLHGRPVLIVGNLDGTLQIINPIGWEVLRSIKTDHASVLISAACTRAGRTTLAVAGKGGGVSVIDVESGNRVLQLRGHRGRIVAMTIIRSSGGEVLATGGTDRTIRLWDLESGKLIRRLESDNWIGGLATLPHQGQQLIAAAAANTLELWDMNTGQLVSKHPGIQCYRSFQPIAPVPRSDGDALVTADLRGAVRLWDGRSAGMTTDGNRAAASLSSVEIEGERLAVQAGGSSVTIRNPHDGRVVRQLDIGGDRYRPLLAAAGDTLLVTSPDNRSLEVRDLETGRLRYTFGRQASVITELCLLEEGRNGPVVASGGSDSLVRVWAVGSQRCLWSLSGHSGSVDALSAVRVSGRKMIASAGRDGSIRLWDLSEGQAVSGLRRPSNRVQALASYDIDGKNLLVGGDSKGFLQWWNLDTGEHWIQATPNTSGIRNLCVIYERPDDPLIATSGDFQDARIISISSLNRPGMQFRVPVHRDVKSLASFNEPELLVGTADGLMSLDITTERPPVRSV